MPPQRRLLLFAKRPRLGKVKSRLTPPYSEAEALELYRAMLRDLATMLAALPESIQVEWWWDAETDEGARLLDDELPPERAQVFIQRGTELGQRLSHAFSLSDGPTAALGGDCALVDAALVEAAFLAVESPRGPGMAGVAAVSPAEDGGYLLIACSNPLPALFEGIGWGSEEVFKQTRLAAERGRIGLKTLPGGFDIDDAHSLERLMQLAEEGRLKGRLPETLRWLKSHHR